MRRRMLGALVGAAVVACGGGTGPVSDRVAEAQVAARFHAWVRAWNLHRSDALAPFYLHEEQLSITWPSGEHTRGWTQESEFQRRYLPTVMVSNLVPQSPRIVLIRKNLALITFAFTLDLAAGGSRQIGPGQGLMLWQPEDGEWWIYAAQLSYTNAVQAPVVLQRK